MFDTICTLPLASDLFAQAIHPTDPIISVGLSSGHVQTFRLPAIGDDGEDPDGAKDGVGKIVTQWQTRRHKGSCRSLAFSHDGEGEQLILISYLLCQFFIFVIWRFFEHMRLIFLQYSIRQAPMALSKPPRRARVK